MIKIKKNNTHKEMFKRFLYLPFKFIFRNKSVFLPIKKDNIKRILIFRYDVIGDMVVTTPIFELIKKYIPECELHVLASELNNKVIENNDRIDKTLILKKGFWSYIKLINQARKIDYDIIFGFVFYRTTFAGVLANLIGKKNTIKITLSYKDRNDIYSYLFNVLFEPPGRYQQTMSEILSQFFFATFGLKYSKNEVKQKIYVPEDIIESVNINLKRYEPKKILLINISVKQERKWVTEKFIELIHYILSDYSVQIIILCVESDIEEAKKIAENFGNEVDIYQSASIFESCAVIMNSEAVITPDTGIVHLSSAMKKPVILLYSQRSSYLAEWMPYDVPSIAVLTNGPVPLSTIESIDVFNAFKKLSAENLLFKL